MNELTHISLFSGIGGFDLAAEWAGFRTIAMCEIDPFCQEVLSARFGAVLANSKGKARFGAVADAAHGDGASRGMRPEIIVAERGHRETVGARHGNQNSGAPLIIPDIRDFDGTRFRGATLLTGGFPCQPFSCAGKRGGKDDDRHLWPEMLRVISESRPHWVLAENVSGIIGMELDQVLADLEMEGYAARTFHIGAVGVNAPHRRMRVWIVAQNTLDNRSGVGESAEQVHIGDERDSLAGDGERLHRQPDADAPQDSLCVRGGGWEQKLHLRRTENGHQVQVAGPDSINSDSDAPDAEGNGERAGLCEGGPGGEWRGRPSDLWGAPWIEVATRFCGMDARISDWIHLYLVGGIDNVPSLKTLTDQDLRVLCKTILTEEVQREIGRLWKIPTQEVLWQILCELKTRADQPSDFSSPSEKIIGRMLRDVWNEAELRRSPSGREHPQQHLQEHANALPFLPYEVASDIEKICQGIEYLRKAIASGRVARLKALGNAIVPACVFPILQAIAQIEREKE